MMTWMKWITRLRSTAATSCDRAETLAPPQPQPSTAPTEYLPLQKYLKDRYADTVVLRFNEIEDLLGFRLPDLARLQPTWWATADEDSTPSVQSSSWTQANRSAMPNLFARTVVFERATVASG
jgi:hypothetical protein